MLGGCVVTCRLASEVMGVVHFDGPAPGSTGSMSDAHTVQSLDRPIRKSGRPLPDLIWVKQEMPKGMGMDVLKGLQS